LRLILTHDKRRKSREEKAALRAHLYPEPQCALGQFLSGHRVANSMMDLSDGLSIDLARLCTASGVGASLFVDQLPMPDLSDRDDALDLALHGGEDYQLLFTVSPTKIAKIPHCFDEIPLQRIGEIQSHKGIKLISPDGKSLPLQSKGWDHFARRLAR
jgi:thiamine-monophosphate kinase